MGSLKGGNNVKAAIALIALLAVVCMAVGAHATEEYAARTNKSCEACHVDPAGGGTLTPEGQAFGQQLPQKTAYRPLGPVLWFLRLIAGFIHIVFGFFWLGTILYVHLILKPAYAAGGLPKSELTLGWVSIIAMAATGTFLTLLRTPSWDALFATRFGLLLTVKIIVFLFMATTASIATFVIGPRLKRKGSAAGTCSNPSDGLSSFDGQEGRPAFIGYAGTMYDVSNSPSGRAVHIWSATRPDRTSPRP